MGVQAQVRTKVRMIVATCRRVGKLLAENGHHADSLMEEKRDDQLNLFPSKAENTIGSYRGIYAEFGKMQYLEADLHEPG